MSAILTIGTAVPRYKYRQSEIGDFMKRLYGFEKRDADKLDILYQRSGIETRNCIICDFRSAPQDRIFYPQTENFEPVPSIEKRMGLYAKESLPLASAAIEQALGVDVDKKAITHLITVSCTGMSAPGLDVQLVKQLQLEPNIKRTSVNFMGCYAAIHALKQADAIAKADPTALVLVVCVEICSIHFQKEQDMDNITANLLFGDGAAAVVVGGKQKTNSWQKPVLRLNQFYSEINYSGETDMAWNISSVGFLMRLSSYIPTLIQQGIQEFVQKSLETNGSTKEDIDFWAIHPGGRKILDLVTQEMQLDSKALQVSYDVLREHGNMSSPTILFVLKSIFDSISSQDEGKLVYGLAFGPGLTQESMVLEVA